MKRRKSTVGFVYVYSNPAWRNLRQFSRPNGHVGALKIGYTQQTLTARGLQIQKSAGLIAKCTVEWYWQVDNCRAVEKAAHAALREYRISRQCEMFCVPLEHIKATIENLLQPPAPPKRSLPKWLKNLALFLI